MPPALSDDDDSASETEIPYKYVDKKASNAQPTQDDDEDELAEDEYKVERIISHKSDDRDRIVKYEVKWLDFDKITDRTWEPRGNLWDEEIDCPIEPLQEYWDKFCGGVEPEYVPKTRRKQMALEAERVAGAGSATKKTPKAAPTKKRKLSQSTQSTPTATDTKGRRKSGQGKESSTPHEEDLAPRKTLQLPAGSWESAIWGIHTIEEERDEKTGKMTRYGYVEWVDPKRGRSKHALQVLRIKCPQKMLDYYEQHLVFNPIAEPN